ncbi:hypothetical protein CTE05_09670 [Cellulomonas terrae]|uniref:DUF4157 domain-containing protein n=1 Tax=Cellulomonas terrae TaxID=311234 RepID=A0A511JHE9_9CELL|nr:hypothetical protein CTE05_09670 [Cellulomonas terrae]
MHDPRSERPVPPTPLPTLLSVGRTDDPLEAAADSLSGTTYARRPAGRARPPEGSAPPSVHAALSGPGHPLDPAARARLEPRLGHGLGAVRVYWGAAADRSAEDLRAEAYTVGSRVALGRGHHPASPQGQELLAHELAHVVQQTHGLDLRVQRREFGEGVRFDSLDGDPPRARFLGPYTDRAIATELYGDPDAPVSHSPDESMVVLIDTGRLLPAWASFFDTAPQRNTWPFPGFSTADVRAYVDERAAALAINLVAGQAVITLDDGTILRTLLRDLDPSDLDVLPLIPPRATRQDADAEVAARADAFRPGGLTVVAFYRDAHVVWPTLLNPQTAPRIFSVYQPALDAARDDAAATASAFTDLAFWYIGARFLPGVGAGGSAARTGRLVIEGGRTLSAQESVIVGRLIREGRNVRVLAESTRHGVRTADFIVDGVRTELKTITSLTSRDLSGALGRRILEGAGQAPHIIADVRGQAGITRELAERAVRRAFGADTLGRIQQIRVIGRDFDLVVPRL